MGDRWQKRRRGGRVVCRIEGGVGCRQGKAAARLVVWAHEGEIAAKRVPGVLVVDITESAGSPSMVRCPAVETAARPSSRRGS